jgi:ribosome-binding protein aMBF1 (putative translation factor)
MSKRKRDPRALASRERLKHFLASHPTATYAEAVSGSKSPESKTRGERLRECLKAKGMSMAKLARMVGAHPVTAWRWADGRNEISAEFREKILQAIGLALFWMVLIVPIRMLFS